MDRHNHDIAIIGMAGRVPGATDLDSFWTNLREGRNSISRFSESELLASDYALEEVMGDPGFVPARGVLEGIELFDAEFFGFRPREAASLDPQQRVWFECAWEALEDAGIAPSKTDERIGVFAGGGYLNTYLMLNLCQDRDAVERLVRLRSVDAFQNIINNDKDFLPTRTSHLFGLTGPSVNVQTACSTSLVSVVMASQSLTLGESDVCLAGGISIQLPQVRGYLAQEGGMDSCDGVVRPFDAGANGTVFGNGVGVVVLKRLPDAQRDGDRILAVLKGYALNNDGSRRASYVAPSLEGQKDVIRRAMTMARVDAGGLSYVEAHGTGTATGDPIEVEALSSVYKESTERRAYCGIGSVKGNVGHLDSAAGVVGLIKVLLALQHEELPPNINFESPNPKIDFDESPFYVVRDRCAWPRAEAPRRAAVSSFGVGGTNAHVVLEDAPDAPSMPVVSGVDRRSWHLLAISAKSEAALDARCSDLADYIGAEQPGLGALAASLMNRREDMPVRRFLVAENCSDAETALKTLDSKRLVSGVCKPPPAGTASPDVVFMFPGQGAQALEMARGLYETEAVFRDTFDECAVQFEPLIGRSLRALLYPEGVQDDPEAEQALTQTRLAQPAMFAVEIALARLWAHWGIEPSAMIGHSLGDFTAACLSGVFTLPGAIAAIAARSKLMQACDPGSMLAVQRPHEVVQELLDGQDRISLAAVNGPRNCVVAGAAGDIETFAAACAGQKIDTRPLHTSHAFHSEMMRQAVEPFRKALADIGLHAPEIPMVSSRTGRLLSEAEATDPAFWAAQILDPVRFYDGLRALDADAGRLFLEVGPGTTLSSLARQAGAGKNGAVIASLGHPSDERTDRAKILEAAGRLWLAGALPQPSPLFDNESPALPLPTYPFQRKRYWVDRPENAPDHAAPRRVAHPETTHSDIAMSTPDTTAPSRLPGIRSALAEIFEEYSGLDVESEGQDVTFLEMGFDSLFLTQIATALQNQFGVQMKFRRMLEDLCTLDALAGFFDEELPPEAFAEVAESASESGHADVSQTAAAPHPDESAPAPAMAPHAPTVGSAPVSSGLPEGAGASASMAQSIVQQQLAIMQQQLALLGGAASAGAVSSPGSAAPGMPASAGRHGGEPAPAPAPGTREAAAPRTDDGESAGVPAAARKPQAFGAQARISTDQDDEFTPRQRQCFDAFVERYVAKTGQSKSFTQKYRKVMSDPRVVTGFRPLWKELVYPLVVERSKGPRLWDLDGNEYVDLTCGFGSNFLGNQPEFLTDAIQAQIERGYEVGPQHPLTADVAELVSELTGMERVAFCNTGSEAVMGAMRAARTITGRSLVAIFSNSYHGIFDEVIVRGTKKLRSIAAAPGILASAVENVLVLEYGDPESLRILRERGHELAAIMAEPVQSRNPKLQPREFLHELRSIADDCGAALIFDEVITGFRISPGGAQEHFGVRADLATYGKIIGGGLPFAAIAGGPKFMDALDGGDWQFGDDSYPEVGVTYFAGTFVRHPLALAAAKASLEHLKEQGPSLQRDLNARTTAFVEGLRDLFQRTGAPITIDQFGSLCRITVSEDEPFGSLLYYWLRFHGVHIWEGFGTFLTTSHTEDDIRHLHQAFESSIEELQAGDLLSGAPGASPEASPAHEHRAPKPGASSAEDIPMTDAQQEIWLASQMGPAASCAYNESFTLSLDGELDTRAFRSAVDHVSKRHEALQLRFDPGGSHQFLVPFEPAELPVHDWREKSQKEIEAAMADVLEREATEPFDLEAGPLIRNALYRLDDARWVFVSTAHHIVFDGWSAGVYIDEIGQAYSRLRSGQEPELAPAPSFIDYVRHEAGEIHSDAGREALAYWADVYRDPPRPLELPLVRERPPWRRFSARSVHWTFSDETYQAARRAAARNNATLYGLLLATFGAYLHRLTGQDDIVVGIPTAGQAMNGQYSLVGHCVNILPLRTRVTPGQGFDEYLADTARLILDAQEHQPATLGAILRNAPIERHPERAPLVEVVFNLNRKLPEESFEGLKTRVSEVEKRSLIWDMFLNCSEEEGRLTTDFDYNADLFDEPAILRFLEGFEYLLAAVSEHAERSVSRLPVMNDAAERALLSLGRGASVQGEGSSFLEMFDRQVAERPDATAVCHRETTLTYAELDRAADSVAASLRSTLGEWDEQPMIGICMPRSERMLVAILGIWKAGGAYLPLDPAFPDDRLSFMLEDAGAALLIVEDEIPLDFDGPTLAFGSIGAGDGEKPVVEVGENDLAYVIYTSGSTGKPKGVRIGHDQVCNLLHSMAREPGLVAEDVLLAVITLSFDMSVPELFLPLSVGATVHVATEDETVDGEQLSNLIASSGATVLQATPSTWRMLIEAGWEGKPDLKAITGGEPLLRDLAEALVPRVEGLWNMYGPTEITVYATCQKIVDTTDRITIGRPIDNAHVYVLDENRQLVPVGVVGELYVGGAGVAEGYHRQDSLTRERFLEDPFQGAPGARMYRTGDRARLLPDGRVEHVGRMDHQIKVRGFRIEPGEIEAYLNEQAGIEQAVVRVFEPSPGDHRLVAYLVASTAVCPTTVELRQALRERLPDYMIPQHFQQIDALPLTPNGKIDRNALPKPENFLETGQAFVAPATDTERTIADIWAELIGVEQVGRDDNFFELGGHSILAARVVNRLRSELEPALAFPHLFEAPTVAELAAEVENLRFARAGTGADGSAGEELVL